jgi:hypothetical protein
MAMRKSKAAPRVPEPSGDVVGRTLQLMGLGHQVWRLDIFRRWPDAVGPKIAARTQPQSFSRGVLLVRAASATWQNELMFLRKTILARLNALLDEPRVMELKVISGHLPPPAPKVAKVPAKPAEVTQQTARLCAASIPDASVREAFTAFMAHTLHHQQDVADKPVPAPRPGPTKT